MYLYVISKEERAAHVERAAIRNIRTNGDISIVVFSPDNAVKPLMQLINIDRGAIANACFAIDGHDSNAIAEFNACLRSVRVTERDNGDTPVVIRSINVF